MGVLISESANRNPQSAMPVPPLTSRRVWLPAVGLLFVLALLPHRFCVYGPPLHGTVMTLLGFLSEPLVSISSRIKQQIDPPDVGGGKLETLREQVLHQDAVIRNLKRRIHSLRRINAELQGLREQLGEAYLLRHVSVIGVSGGGSGTTLQIDRGSQDGMSIGMAVVDGANLIGRIVQVAPTSSTVEPMTAEGNLLTVMLTPPGLAASGRPWEPRRTCQLEAQGPRLLTADVDRELPVEVGYYARLEDQDGPSGWSAAVQGRIVGRVTRVEPLPDDLLRKRITVRPMLAPRHVDEATVIMPRGAVDEADPAPRGVRQP